MKLFETKDQNDVFVYINLDTISFVTSTSKSNYIYFNNGLKIILNSKEFADLLIESIKTNKKGLK